MEKPSHIALTSYFKGQSKEEETAYIEQWRRHHEEEYNEMEKIWNAHGSLASTFIPDLEAAWDSIDERTSDKFPMRWIYGLAASILMVLGVTWLLQSSNPEAARATYFAADGKKTFDLLDGSRITLSKGSRLMVEDGFGTDHRAIELAGKGFFEVATDKTLPFTVSTKHLAVEVLGTSFEVDDFAQLPSVKVVEGTVLVKTDWSEIELGIGEMAALDENSLLSKVPMDQNAMAWKTSTLVFTDASLEKLAMDVSAYYGITLEVSPELADRKITSTFSEQSLEEVLAIIGTSLGVTIDSLGAGHYRIE